MTMQFEKWQLRAIVEADSFLFYSLAVRSINVLEKEPEHIYIALHLGLDNWNSGLETIGMGQWR
jgi:hypothetical protein